MPIRAFSGGKFFLKTWSNKIFKTSKWSFVFEDFLARVSSKDK